MQGPAPVPPFHNPKALEGFILSTLRGLRNGVVCGIRIRLPYIIQAVAYAIIFREKKYAFLFLAPIFFRARLGQGPFLLFCIDCPAGACVRTRPFFLFRWAGDAGKSLRDLYFRIYYGCILREFCVRLC